MEDRGVGRGKKRRQRRGGGKTSDLRPWLICLLAMMRMIRQKVWVFLIWLSPAGLVLKRVVFALLAWVCFPPSKQPKSTRSRSDRFVLPPHCLSHPVSFVCIRVYALHCLLWRVLLFAPYSPSLPLKPLYPPVLWPGVLEDQAEQGLLAELSAGCISAHWDSWIFTVACCFLCLFEDLLKGEVLAISMSQPVMSALVSIDFRLGLFSHADPVTITANIDHLGAELLLRPLHLSTHVLTDMPEEGKNPFYPLTLAPISSFPQLDWLAVNNPRRREKLPYTTFNSILFPNTPSSRGGHADGAHHTLYRPSLSLTSGSSARQPSPSIP